MPFVKRQVEPIELSRAKIPPSITNKELDFITNHTLANIIHQLSSLSKHAEDLFDELYHQSEKLIIRTTAVTRRVQLLQGKVKNLDATVEEVSLRDISHTRSFRSNRQCQQQVVSRDTMPTALRQLYEACDPPPPLQKLTPYRPDGKDALKFYTDPSYFFELWRQQLLKETERPSHQHQQVGGATSGKHDGEKGRRGNRHKSPGGGPASAAQNGAAAPAVQNNADPREIGKTVRQPGTNRLDKYRQKAVEQDFIHNAPGNSQMPPPSQSQQVQYQQQQQHSMMYGMQQHQQRPHGADQQYQNAAQQQVFLLQQQMQMQQQQQQQYQPANTAVLNQQQQQQQQQQQKSYPAFVVSGLAAIPPIIGALDAPQQQLWSSHAPSTIPPLNGNYANPSQAVGANAVAAAALFPGHTPTSANSMLVDENGHPAPFSQQQLANTINYAMQQQQPQNIVLPQSMQQQQQMTMANVESALQHHQYIAASMMNVQPHADDIIYHTRTIPPVVSSSSGAVPPSSLPLTNTNSSMMPQQQRTITTGGSGGASPSRPMQPPPAPPSSLMLQQQQQNVPSPLPPPSVGELTKQQGDFASQFQNLAVATEHSKYSVPPPPPPPLPLTAVKPIAPKNSRVSNETDAPSLPVKAGSAAAPTMLAFAKTPSEFPPAPTNADMRVHDQRSDLLAEIRRGIALRKRSLATNSAAESGSVLGATDSDNVSLSSSALQASTGGGGHASGINRQTSTRTAKESELRDVAMLMARRIAIRGRANSDESESDDAGGFTGHSGDTDEWEG